MVIRSDYRYLYPAAALATKLMAYPSGNLQVIPRGQVLRRSTS
jgi:hypothetical protein